MTNDPLVHAARQILDESLDELAAALAGLSAAQLDMRPAPDTNPLSVLAVHALASTRSWLSLATASPLPERDRPSEFRTTVEDADAFRREVEERAAACRELLAGDVTIDPGRADVAPWRSGPERDEPVTAAWALLHALEHLREHVGHAQLTRQLVT